MKKLFGKHKWMKVLLPVVLIAVVMALSIPVFAAVPDYVTVTGVYDIRSNIASKYLDGSRHSSMPRAALQLTITTQTFSVISDATLTTTCGDIPMTGVVGGGAKPYITLSGTNSAGTSINLYGRFKVVDDVATRLYGRIDGFTNSEGNHYAVGDGTSAASIVAAYDGSYSTLLTAGTGANPVTVILPFPRNSFRLSQMDTLVAGRNGLSFYFNLEAAAGPGPQIMLRFVPKGDTNMDYYYPAATAGHVDITIMPYQAPYVGLGTWVKYTVTSDSGICMYYGGDPTDYTGFGGDVITTLGEVEAAINAEAAMIAGSDSASSWVLTMVAVELWEAGARTCYVDDIQIGRYTYTLEPVRFDGRFSATVVE